MILEIISTFKDEILKIAGAQLDEIKQSLDDGLNEYTISWRDKINKVKTYLFDETPVNFEDIYVPLNVRIDKRSTPIPDQVDKLFRGTNCLIVLGHAGSGKTMLMKHSFLRALDNGQYIPIIIELRRIDSLNLTLLEYISSMVFKLHLAKNELIFNRMMSQGKFLFFFDGYDEISVECKTQRTNEIEDTVDRFPNNLYWLSSRPGAGAENLERFRSIHVCDMDDYQVRLFVKKQTRYTDEDSSAVADNILKAIFSTAANNIRAYLHNPLLLSMFILTYRYNPEIPKKKSDFYYNVFDTLYIKHDTRSKSGSYLHDRKCKFEKDQYLQVLRYFSFISFFNAKYLFDTSYLNRKLSEIKSKYSLAFDNDDMIYDLSVSIAILIKDGLDYTFPHRSMQEYFSADLISTLQDAAKKDVVYKKVFSRNFGSDGFNFWSLCEELDELCFQSYFLLKNLKEYDKILTNPREGIAALEQIVFLNFLDHANTEITVNMKGINSVRYYANLYGTVTKYVLRNDTLIDGIFMWAVKHPEEIKLLMAKNDITDDIACVDLLPKSKEDVDYMLNTSLPYEVYQNYLKLKEKISELEKNIKTKKLQEKNLIDLL